MLFIIILSKEDLSNHSRVNVLNFFASAQKVVSLFHRYNISVS